MGRFYPVRAATAIINHVTVADFHYPVRVLGHQPIVGNHDHRVALFRQRLELAHHRLATDTVQRAGGLIGENHLAAIHQGTGNGHPLLLATG